MIRQRRRVTFFSSLLEETEANLLQVFADSELKNLRVLKQLLWDFERIWKVISIEQRTHKGAMRELLTLLCAAALELRSGRLRESDYQNDDPTRFMLPSMKKVDSSIPMDQVRSRYPTVRFDTALLDAATIRDCVLRSSVSREHVQDQLKRHPYFAKPKDETLSWRALWLSFEALPENQDKLVQRFEADFDARRFTDRGSIYHVIGLSLWLARLGFPSWPKEGVEAKVKAYVVDVYARRAAEIHEVAGQWFHDRHIVESADGLGFKECQEPLFANLVRFERAERDVWLRRAYPMVAAHLAELIKSDSQTFLREVCFTNGYSAKYAGVGVLKPLCPNDFAAIIVAARYPAQKDILIALSLRYEQATAYAELQDELSWLQEVRDHLETAAAALPPIAREALLNLVRHYIDKKTLKGRAVG